MRRIVLLMVAAMLVAVMMAFSAGPAFAVCPVCPVEANDQAQGSFSTGTTHAVPNSDRHAEEGLRNAFMHNTNP